MQMKKRILTFLTAAAVALSLIACGRGSSSPSKGAVGETTSEIITKYEDAVTLHIVTEDNPNVSYFPGENITNNWWTKQYRERFNIEIVVDWYTSDTTTYNTKLNLAAASKELPDTFKVYTLKQLKELVEAGMLMDMSAVFDQYASDLLRELMGESADVFNSGRIDGGLYGISQLSYGTISQPFYVWLRDDWMREQNLTAPKTIADLENIMKVFKEAYGAYGFALSKGLTELYEIANAWNVYPTIWVENGEGTIEPGCIQPGMKDVLATFAEWYRKGYIDPNFTTYDWSAMVGSNVNGSCGVQVFQQWWGWNPGSDVVKMQGKDAVFYPYEIPTVTGEAPIYPLTFDNSGYTVVSRDCEHPEAVIMLMNFYAEVYYADRAGVDEEIREFAGTDVGYANIAGPFRVLSPAAEDDTYLRVSQAITTGDTSCLVSTDKYEDSMRWIRDGDSVGLGAYLQCGACDRSAYALGHQILEENRTIRNRIWGDTPEVMDMYGGTLDDMLLEGFTRIIIGEESVDYFDMLVTNWRNAGGSTIIQAANEMYGAG